MWNRILDFLRAPVFAGNEEKTRRARVLNALHLNMGVAILVLGSLGVIFFFTEKVITSLILLAEMMIIFICIVFNRRGHVLASGILLLGSLWGLTVFAVSISGGMHSLDIIFFVSGTVMAGIILGVQGALSYAGLSLLAGLVLIGLGNAGVIFPQMFAFPPLGVWAILFINLAFTVVPLQVTFQSLTDSALRIRFSEERYRMIASLMSDYAYSVQLGEHGEVIDQWRGGAFESITGYNADDFFDQGSWRSIVHPDDREKDIQDISQLNENKSVVTEIRIIRKDGDVRWVRSYAQPKWDEKSKRLVGIYGAVQDITRHKQVDAELRQRAEEISLLYRLSMALAGGQNLYETLRAFVQELRNVMIVDAFHIGLYDEETDLFTYPLFLNLKEDFQPPPRKLKDNPGLTWEVISGRKTLYLPDVSNPQTQREHNIVVVVEAPIQSYIGIPLILQDRVIGVMSVQSLQKNAYTKDQIRLLETLAAQAAITIEKLSLLEQLQLELVERTKAESELQERDAILEVVADAANTFLKISEWNTNTWREEVDKLLEHLGVTINASHAYLFENHLSQNGMMGMSMRNEWTAPGLTSDLDDPYFKETPLEDVDLPSWNACIPHGKPCIGDAAHFKAEEMEYLYQKYGMYALLEVPILIDGQWWGTIGFDDVVSPRIWLTAEVDALMLASNLLSAGIKRLQMDSILQNELRQRKVLIDELENKNAELERFTYAVSHDLRSPLVTIRGFLGLLEKSVNQGDIDSFQKDLQRISNATLRMDNLLRDVLQLSRVGHLINKSQDVPFDELVKETLDIVHGQLEGGNVTLHTQPNLPAVYGDKPRLVEVLQNLIDNAIKYMGDQKDPLIEIGAKDVEDDKPVFYVKDNGIGIAPEYHEQIFRLFDKLDATSEGTGVGLALVKRIVEIHGGKIWVESEVGNGAAFYFTLPKSKTDEV
ncbi:MAG: ATP-binding protein [Anaerolineales bacterium]